jgi:hypothetical protein
MTKKRGELKRRTRTKVKSAKTGERGETRTKTSEGAVNCRTNLRA